MSWAKLDDGFYDHPKVLRAGLEATGLYCIALSYVARYATDGVLEPAVLTRLSGGNVALVTRLLEVGLFEHDGDGRVVIHDYLDYNLSAKSLHRERKAARQRMHVFRSCSPEQTLVFGKCSANVPDGTGRDGDSSSAGKRKEREKGEGGAAAADFDAFWLAYPRKVGKPTARRAWAKTARDRPMLATVLGALAIQARSEQWQEPRYIPHPATWLNDQRWNDETPEQRARSDGDARVARLTAIKRRSAAELGLTAEKLAEVGL